MVDFIFKRKLLVVGLRGENLDGRKIILSITMVQMKDRQGE